MNRITLQVAAATSNLVTGARARTSAAAALLATAALAATAAVAATPGPMPNRYFGGAANCVAHGKCFPVQAQAGYVDRGKLTASFTHAAVARGGGTNVDYFSVYASAKRHLSVEWEMACRFSPSSDTEVTQGTFVLNAKGRRHLGRHSSRGSSCTAKAAARGKGRVYVEIDGKPYLPMAAVNAGDPPPLP